ncbi:hypothetical protein QQF64_024841 [Cirrhinus molitorella]|uniref:Uncharacterized protein n=1 Tax=Cirrhinus molitorella TaxID=172907 RepID=A0ABR3NNA4_9TELE
MTRRTPSTTTAPSIASSDISSLLFVRRFTLYLNFPGSLLCPSRSPSVMAASSSGTTAPLETSDTYRALYFLTGLGLKSKVEGDFKAVGEVFFLS